MPGPPHSYSGSTSSSSASSSSAAARLAPALATRPARYSLLNIHLLSDSFAGGVLLEDPATDRLYIRLRRDWEQVAPEEAEVLSLLEDDLATKANEMGAAALFGHLEETLSNTIHVTDRRATIVEDFERGLARLYRQHVHSSVQQWVTHLPRYSLTAAAGAFLENPVIETDTLNPDTWEETPAHLRLTPEMFVARVAGRSMEPLIADGSLCIFRRGVTGSRQGRLVLVEATGSALGADDRYTVKRYRSEKTQRPSADNSNDDTWTHQRIRLEPLNSEFEAWDLDPEEDRYRIIAEFVQVLD